MNTVVGLFDHYENAEWAIEVLEHYADVGGDCISVVALDKDAIEPRLTAGTDDAVGAATEGLVGLLNGPSALAFVIPEVGPVVAIGAVAVKLFATLDIPDAGSGGLLGILIDSGFSEQEAEFYMESVKQGGILVFVETNLQNEFCINAILRGSGAVVMNTSCETSHGESWRTTVDEIQEAYPTPR